MTIASAVLCILALIALCSCHYINQKLGLKNDNKIEQAIEDVIEQKTGIQVDLTPNSDEDSKE